MDFLSIAGLVAPVNEKCLGYPVDDLRPKQ